MKLVAKLVATGLLAAMAVSCATGPEPVVAPRPELIRREVRTLIADGRPEAAVQRISALRREEVVETAVLDTLYRDATATMRDLYERAVEEGRPRDAVRLYRNLVAVGAADDDPRQISLHYLEAARMLADEGNEPAALATLLQAPQLSNLPAQALEEAAGIAVRLNNRYAVSILTELLGPSWRDENPDVVAFGEGAASPIEMSAGVVTVWVNRGLRLEGGMGIPDRVIGSGFFIDPRGYIVTNYHVIASEVDPRYEGYSRLYIRLPSDPAGRIPARVIGYSRAFDVALLKAEIDAPYVFSFTDIRSLEPGTSIMAIGSPGGLETSITSGIISAVGRRFLQMGDAMQMDVPVNPGSSGGPLLDRQGRLVGVVFAGIQQFEGVNFAIPSYWLNAFLPELFAEGRVVHPWIGIAAEPVSGGLEVTYVARSSPASEAGLEAGDVITSIGQWPVTRIGPAQSILLQHEVGSLLPVRWQRDGEELKGLVSLASRPEIPVEEALERDLHERLYPVLFGMQVERIGGLSLRPNYEVTRVYRGSMADESGITAGDRFIERDFSYDERRRVVFLQMFIQKRTQGFLQTGMQLPAYVERDNFL